MPLPFAKSHNLFSISTVESHLTGIKSSFAPSKSSQKAISCVLKKLERGTKGLKMIYSR